MTSQDDSSPPHRILASQPNLASLRKDRECVYQTHERGSSVLDWQVGSKQRWCRGQDRSLTLEGLKHSGGANHATIINQQSPTIWFSCRPVRRKNQGAAYRQAPRTAVRRVTQGGA